MMYIAIFGAFCLIFYRIIYNIYLHPLSHIPGPKIATCSSLWKFYHDVVRGGRYLWEIRVATNQTHGKPALQVGWLAN